jgi:hypothetical protein
VTGYFVKNEIFLAFPPLRRGWKAFFFFVVLILNFAAPLGAAPTDSLLTQARLLYYASLQDKSKLDSAIAMFEKIGEREARFQGRAETYIGSLTAVRAKYAFWPHQKWKWAKSGLRRMDAGLAQSPDDIEALFIHGTTCYYLPKFFGRAGAAQRSLREIMRLLPEQAHDYDPKMLGNVIKFLMEKLNLTENEREHLTMINAKLAQK